MRAVGEVAGVRVRVDGFGVVARIYVGESARVAGLSAFFGDFYDFFVRAVGEVAGVGVAG